MEARGSRSACREDFAKADFWIRPEGNLAVDHKQGETMDQRPVVKCSFALVH